MTISDSGSPKPKLVAEVASIEWTSDGSIRLPSFQGSRKDKSPKEVVREVKLNDFAGQIGSLQVHSAGN